MYGVRSTPAPFIPPCRPTWLGAQLKHDGYRLQIPVRAACGSTRGLREPIIIDAEVVHLAANGAADFDALHSRTVDNNAVACAFDLLVSGDDIRRRPLLERKNALKWIFRNSRGGIQYVEHTEGDGEEMFKAICKLGLEGIVSKKLRSVYRSGPSKAWLKIKNPKAPAATRVIDGTF